MNNLTPREREVVRMAAGGQRTKVIAHELGISYGTAKLHLANAYRKLGIKGRIALMHAWMAHEGRPVKREVPVHEIDWGVT
jgi:DNA-binding NarL/FixJ family response regulator